MQRALVLPTLLLFLFLSACDGNTQARKAARGETFVPDPNYLYFNNIRQYHYHLVDENQRGNYFTHEDLLTTDASLIPVIHDDWLNDQAYLELHTRRITGPAAPTGPVTLVISSPTGNNVVTLPTRVTVAQARQLAHHINTNREISIALGTDTLPAFPGKARAFAKETLDDYLRLVENN